jgi:hypothetical protein
MGDRIFNVMGSIVVVAGITTVVSNRNSAGVIRALGNAFSNALLSAQGKRP